MTVSEALRLKELEAENSELKRLLADAELDKAALKDLLDRKSTSRSKLFLQNETIFWLWPGSLRPLRTKVG